MVGQDPKALTWCQYQVQWPAPLTSAQSCRKGGLLQHGCGEGSSSEAVATLVPLNKSLNTVTVSRALWCTPAIQALGHPLQFSEILFQKF